MWYLVNRIGERFYLPPNKEIVFGRKKGQILLNDDDSISRLHASIFVEPKEAMQINEPTSICKVKDIDSKYGTYILNGDDRIEVFEEGHNLKNHDKIRFGLQQHIYTAVYVPLVIVISSLNDNDKEELYRLMDKIDGWISNDWISNCTHLTVSRAALTEKVTCAMASAVPIVTVAYWKQVACAMESGADLPNAQSFVPLLSESLVNKRNVSLCPNKKRTTLFENMIFVCLSTHQYRTYGKIVNLAGGKPLLYTKRPLTTKELCAPNVIVLQYPENDTTQSTLNIPSEYESIIAALLKSGRKMIPESDIPLAILHCSTEKYCNPKFKFARFFKRTQSNYHSSKVLVQDTQDVSADVRILPRVISDIPIKSDMTIHTAKKKRAEIISDTNDDACSQCFLDDDAAGNLKNCLESDELKIIVKTKDKYSDRTLRKEIEKSKKTSKKDMVYIPETIDSSCLHETEESGESFSLVKKFQTQKIQQTQKDKESIESMVVIKETSFDDVIELSTSIDSEVKRIRSHIGSNQDTNDIYIPESFETSTPKSQKKNLSENFNVGLAEKNCAIIKLRRIDQNYINLKRKSWSSSDRDSDPEYDVRGKKVVCLNSENATKSQRNAASFGTEYQESHNNLTRETSSFLRLHTNYKKFNKVYNKIPKERITLDDMYLWEKM